MKIHSLMLKNFGKFAGREIELADGINLIYGANESGKSTLHTFLKGMLFGMERGRGRAAATDTFSQYEPWENPAHYAGSMRFSCGGRNFCLERHFDKYSKSASLFCEDDGEELSIEHGDLEMLLEGMQESEYENTISIKQLGSSVGASLAARLKDYAANYYAAGSSELQLHAAITALKEKERSLDKELRKADMEKQARRDRIEQEASYIWRDMHRLEKEISQAREAQDSCKEEWEKQEEKIRRRQELEGQKGRFDNWRIHPFEMLIMVLAVVLSFILFRRPWNFLVAIVVALAAGLYVWNSLKDGRRKREEASLEEKGISDELNNAMSKHIWTLDKLEEEYREKQVQYENLKEQLEETELSGSAGEEYENRRGALQLAIETIQELAEQMQNQMSQTLNEQISKNLRAITGGKYSKVWMDDSLDIYVYCEGRKVPMYRLSRGTMEQIYLSIRLAAAQMLYDEKYPLVLDDTFAYYDDRRLENTMKMLGEYPGQVIILTCHEREERALERIGGRYWRVEL
ncbi:AAA family ATPase [Roseburia hominis]